MDEFDRAIINSLQGGFEICEHPFAAAGSLLQRVTGFTPDRTQAELNWYSKEQCYPLSYLTGNRMVWELKDDLVSANPKGLSTEELEERSTALE